MGALLLPKLLVTKALEPRLRVQGMLKQPILPGERREDGARILADAFDVNPIVAKIRIETLYPSAADRQLTL